MDTQKTRNKLIDSQLIAFMVMMSKNKEIER